MTKNINPSWYRALTLSERAAMAHLVPDGSNAVESENSFQEWRSQPPFERAQIFAKRLAQDGLSEETFRTLLSTPPETYAAQFDEIPSWMRTLRNALSDPTLFAPILWPEIASGIPNLGLLAVATPLINGALRDLRAEIDALQKQVDTLPFEPGTTESLFLPDLAKRLVPILSRTLVLEMHVARLQGLLEGETGEERFASFGVRLQRPDVAEALWDEYPVLARQVVVGIEQWVGASKDFLQHLSEDWTVLRAAFFSRNDPGLLSGLEAGAGDHHGDGRSVIIATFSHGDKLVYKPHSLLVDLAFQELLSQLNAWGAKPAFRTLQTLERDSYGWVEFVHGASCSTRQALHRFYERMGGYLALLYILEGGDVHHENLIAAGEHPILIDLEALFQPQIKEERYVDPATKFFYNSVMRTSLLPTRDWAAGKGQGIDISGLGGEPGQLTPFAVPRWDGAGSDSMHLTRRQVALETKEHRPTLEGELVNPGNYIDMLVSGFTNIYHLLLQHRDELLEPSGPLSPFAQAEVRVILRPTQQYGLLVQESYHPDLLRDALARDRVFDKLWVGAADAPFLQQALPFEQAAMQRGDIPRFVTRPGSLDLWNDAGTCLPDFLTQAGRAQVERRLAHMGDDDLQGQLWLIRASLSTLAEPTAPEQTERASLRAVRKPASRDALQAMACKLGDRLAEQAILADDDAGWLGLSPREDGLPGLAPLGLDLYDGLPGVAFFLAYLGKATGDEKYSVLARAALRSIQKRLAVEADSIGNIGAFGGYGGLIYAFTHLGSLWSEQDLLTQARVLATSLAKRIDEDRSLDVIAGAAGCLGVLLALHKVTGDAAVLTLAVQCGNHLVGHAKSQKVGAAWRTIPGVETALTGFGHGAAGIAWACGQLAEATHDARFQGAAQAALDYERSLFNEEVSNWPDLRKLDQNQFMVAWCHGAAGIGLSRLSQTDWVARTEVERAVRTTISSGFGRSHSLCHGDLGNLDFLQLAAKYLQDQELSMLSNRLAASLLANLQREERHAALRLRAESPGLMTGIAGIGYGLLRLADPEQIPCVLLLAPPNLFV